MRHILVTLLVAGLVGVTTVGPAVADSTGEEVVYGTGSVFGTLLYAPVKGAFCILGGVTAGLPLPFAGPDTAGHVASRACGGTWAITPAAIKGKEPVRFVGGSGSSSRTAARR